MPITSRNTGFSLDTIQQNPGHDLDLALFGDVIAGEIPTLKDNAAGDGLVHREANMDKVVQSHGDHPGLSNTAEGLDDLSMKVDMLGGKFDDIEYLRADIFDAQGMNRDLALSCEALLPGFLTEQRPIGFFTQLPTRTQYTVSLEFLNSSKEGVIAAMWAVLHELLEKIRSWYEDYRKDQDTAAATLAVRRMYVIQTNADDVARVINDEFKFSNTQDYDAALSARMGTVKEGQEDWLAVHLEKMRTSPFNFKTWIERRKAVMDLFTHEEHFVQLPSIIEEATRLQNQLVGLINSNAEGGVVKLLESPDYERVSTYVNDFSHARLAEAGDLENFHSADVVKMVTKMFKPVTLLQQNLDDRADSVGRMAQAVEKAKQDYAKTSHNSDAIEKIKSAQMVMSKLLGFEVAFQRGMAMLATGIHELVQSYRKDLEALFKKAGKATDDTHGLADILDYKLVERVAGKFDALEGRYSAESEELGRQELIATLEAVQEFFGEPAQELSLEDVKETLKAVWEKLKEWFIKLKKHLTTMIQKMLGTHTQANVAMATYYVDNQQQVEHYLQQLRDFSEDREGSAKIFSSLIPDVHDREAETIYNYFHNLPEKRKFEYTVGTRNLLIVFEKHPELYRGIEERFRFAAEVLQKVRQGTSMKTLEEAVQSVDFDRVKSELTDWQTAVMSASREMDNEDIAVTEILPMIRKHAKILRSLPGTLNQFGDITRIAIDHMLENLDKKWGHSRGGPSSEEERAAWKNISKFKELFYIASNFIFLQSSYLHSMLDMVYHVNNSFNRYWNVLNNLHGFGERLQREDPKRDLSRYFKALDWDQVDNFQHKLKHDMAKFDQYQARPAG